MMLFKANLFQPVNSNSYLFNQNNTEIKMHATCIVL